MERQEGRERMIREAELGGEEEILEKRRLSEQGRAEPGAISCDVSDIAVPPFTFGPPSVSFSFL